MKKVSIPRSISWGVAKNRPGGARAEEGVESASQGTTWDTSDPTKDRDPTEVSDGCRLF